MTIRDRECDVGILEYMSGPEVSGFSGVLKAQWEDFHVHEVDTDRNITHLAEKYDMEALRNVVGDLYARQSGKDVLSSSSEFTLEHQAVAEGKLAKTFVQYLEDYVAYLGSKSACLRSTSRVPVCVTAPSAALPDPGSQSEKQSRAQVHAALKTWFPFLESSTQLMSELGENQTVFVNATSLLKLESKAAKLDALRLILNTPLKSEELPAFQAIVIKPNRTCLNYLKSRQGQFFQGVQGQSPHSTEALSLLRPDGEENGEQPEKHQNLVETLTEPELCRKKKKTTSCFPGQLRGDTHWKKGRHQYLLFHLYKCNRDTTDALEMISRCVRCSPHQFTYAGLKDRRAITVQRITAFKLTKAQLLQGLLNPHWDQSVAISNLAYHPTRLQLGSLYGNYFKVCCRSIPLSQTSQVESAIRHLRTQGFINYFGLQRFGTRHGRTYQTGSHLLKGDPEAAVNCILGNLKGTPITVYPRSWSPNKKPKVDATSPARNGTEATDTHQSQTPPEGGPNLPSHRTLVFQDYTTCYDQGTVKEFVRCLPSTYHLEKRLLRSLDQKPHQYTEALERLPRNMLSLYIHSVQSLIWNFVASYRVQHYGLGPVEGDFVCPPDERDSAHLLPVEYAKHITSCTLLDVVLPIPGTGVKYPSFLVPIYEEICQTKLNLDLATFTTLKPSFLGTYPGNYRFLVVLPMCLNYSIHAYPVYPSDVLIESDLDLLRRRPAVCPALSDDEDLGSDHFESFDELGTDAQDVLLKERPAHLPVVSAGSIPPQSGAFVLRCMLPKSSYITMAFRELFKGNQQDSQDTLT